MNTELQLKDLRLRALMTQQELADKIGISRVALCHYETGRRRVPVSLIVPITNALGCTLEELFGETEEND